MKPKTNRVGEVGKITKTLVFDSNKCSPLMSFSKEPICIADFKRYVNLDSFNQASFVKSSKFSFVQLRVAALKLLCLLLVNVNLLIVRNICSTKWTTASSFALHKLLDALNTEGMFAVEQAGFDHHVKTDRTVKVFPFRLVCMTTTSYFLKRCWFHLKSRLHIL